MKKVISTLFITGMVISSFFCQAQSNSKNEPVPFDILDRFVPCGWMGDCKKGEEFLKFNPVCTDTPHSEPSCIKITYTTGPSYWGGVYWVNKDCNWGEESGFDLSKNKLSKITFWAKGLTGKEFVQFKAGGVNKKEFKDSFDYEPKLGVTLTKEWKKYTLDLTGMNLSCVIGGFCWIAKSSVTFYLDDVFFE